MAKVTIDLDKCVACGMCAYICPETFGSDADSLKAELIGGERTGSRWNLDIQDPGCAQKASEGCPGRAISVE